ncbi:MAG: hypothetical protein IH935_05645 [Acidobacteria bacterium]|nr:hypothetical protein [Acidobacteriota bacterium]
MRSNVFGWRNVSGWPVWKLTLRLSFLTAVFLVTSQSQLALAQVSAPVSAEVSKSSAPRISIFPLADIRPGMRGIGKTVFKGNKIEEFQVEILGVLRNVAPRQNMILARLSGGPLERTGVMAGMSGSPVYIDGKLVGAIASGFQFSKEPIAGITPMEQMLDAFEGVSEEPQQKTTQIAWTFEPGIERGDDLRLIPASEPDWMPPFRSEPSRVFWGGAEMSMVRIATPLMLSGFTAEAMEHFQPQLRALGLIPIQGGSGGSQGDNVMGDLSRLQPGSMISVQLVRGDMGVNADGTVTHVEQGRVYAFGHRLLAAGPIEIPFSESRVITPLAGYAISMKISTPGRLLGVIRQDRSSGIFGRLGETARMIPIEFEMVSGNRTTRTYHFEVVNDRFLLPLLMSMTIFSAIGSTERMVGESTLQVEQTISLAGLPDVKLENYFSGIANGAIRVARSATAPLAYLMQSGLGKADIQKVHLRVTSTDRQMTQTLEQVWVDRREVKAGEKMEVTALLHSLNGEETVQKAWVEVPASLTPGPLTITVADGSSLDRREALRGGRRVLPKNPEQLVRAINKSRRNNRLYVRLERREIGFVLHGETFPSPPPSVVRAFSTDPSLGTTIAPTGMSTVADYELDSLPSVVTGYKRIVVTVTN